MSLNKNVVMITIYNAGLITLGAVGTSMISKKIMKDGLGVTDASRSTQRVLKLAVAVGGGSVMVKYLQKMGYVPEEPGKTKIKFKWQVW